ncbi:MAG: phosphoglycerate kinase [Alphaproteobacteria bacterium]|nr:phosphoglycerate kinase [Alphaproteobacteria bacterium]
MKLRAVDYSAIRGKYVLLRVDFNVQIENGKILDTFRIEQSMPTINKLRESGARVVICAHLGRPRGEHVPELSLRPVADYMKIPFVDDVLNRDFMASMRDGDIVLMENVRFYAGEEKNDLEFAKNLARGFDLFVNDAFAVAHRAAASTVGVTKFLPVFAGELLRAEVENISRLLESPKHPFLAIVGGSKVSSKIGVLKKLCELADTVIVGGALGTTFNFACGENPGNSLYEPDMASVAREIIDFAAAHDCKLLMPLDKGVGSKFERNAVRTDKSVGEIADTDVIIDDGPKTAERNVAEINNAAMVVWNGTVGMAEWGNVWGGSSFKIARAIAERTAAGHLISIVGGGETVAAVDAIGVRGKISYVSTGGGAFLEFIERGTLPALEMLVL